MAAACRAVPKLTASDRSQLFARLAEIHETDLLEGGAPSPAERQALDEAQPMGVFERRVDCVSAGPVDARAGLDDLAAAFGNLVLAGYKQLSHFGSCTRRTEPGGSVCLRRLYQVRRSGGPLNRLPFR